MDEQSAQPPVDRAIASLAAAQRGVVGWSQLREVVGGLVRSLLRF